MKQTIASAALAVLATGALASPTWAQTKQSRNQHSVSAGEQRRAPIQTSQAYRVAPSAAAKQPEYPPNYGWDVSY